MSRRIVICAKAGKYQLIMREPQGDDVLLTGYDPASGHCHRYLFKDAGAGNRCFNKTLAAARDLGWTVAWNGVRSYG